ncbi:hypothetical protein H6G91_37160 [Nostoc muscorum FACHB-395]|jgi:hypothetical protein|uniref:hypothetical protein n=1 Tax=Nostoc punctiforme TaxID=272131 RepID=UPI0016873BE1|nr:hypothetical protein [Desmonostoc muscorum FACHB-395]
MITDLEQTQLSEPVTSTRTWTIVSQVKSHRVVYFTEDTNYTLPAEGDWYYLSPYIGELPKGITLRNCWRWRFNGSSFVDAGSAQQKSSAEVLIQRNRNTLNTMLREKIEVLQKPYCPSSPFGHLARERKLIEAQELLSSEGSKRDYPFLTDAAATYSLTLREMAEVILAKNAEFEEVLRCTELLRERFTVEIAQAETDAELIDIRSRLMEEIAPEINARFAVKTENTTPQQQNQMPSDDELAHEQVRLQVQLRERINALRRTVVSDYVLDDMMLKLKGRIAHAVMMAGGAVPQGIDLTPLISHAAARGMSLEASAHEVLTEMDESAAVLLKTEQMKDILLSRIAVVRSYKDIKAVSKDIQSLTLAVT